MTSKELHQQKIIPARMELKRLEEEYERLYREECKEQNGGKPANCDNCAYSCVLDITDHNECMGGKCTCCNGWCYNWMPENDLSAWFRKHHHYNYEIYSRLEHAFGENFLKTGDVGLIMEMLALMEKVDRYVQKMDRRW